MEIVFVRHAEKLKDCVDSELTKRGIKQVAELGEKLKSEKYLKKLREIDIDITLEIKDKETSAKKAVRILE